MSAKIFSVLCLLLAVYCIYEANAASSEYDDTYYDSKSKAVSQKVTYGTEALNPTKLIAFHGGNCNCANLACSCCTGVRVKKLKFDNEVCAVIEYLKSQIGVKASVKINQKQIYAKEVSVSNPPPLCFTVPDVPAVKLCLKFHDLSVSGGKLNACVDLETRVSKLPALVLHFKCLSI